MLVSKPAAYAAPRLTLGLTLGLAAGLMLLAGCSKGGATNSAAAGGPAPAPTASGPDVTIKASDLPRLKAGYWETTTTTTSSAANSAGPEIHRFCSSGKPVSPPPQMGRGCSTFSFKRTFLDAIVIDADCAEGPISSKLHMTASGDFNSTYTTDSQVSIAMQGKPATSYATHTVSRWVGPCPAGATPDD